MRINLPKVLSPEYRPRRTVINKTNYKYSLYIHQLTSVKQKRYFVCCARNSNTVDLSPPLDTRRSSGDHWALHNWPKLSRYLYLYKCLGDPCALVVRWKCKYLPTSMAIYRDIGQTMTMAFIERWSSAYWKTNWEITVRYNEIAERSGATKRDQRETDKFAVRWKSYKRSLRQL